MLPTRRRVMCTAVFQALLVVCVHVCAEAQEPHSVGLKLIPTPKSVSRGQGLFRITNRTCIVLGNTRYAEDRFAAQQLVEEIKHDLELDVKLTLQLRPHGVILIGRTDSSLVSRALARLGATLPEEAVAEGYVLAVRPRDVLVAARSSAGVFYGVQTLKQLVRGNRHGTAIPCCTISDWPGLAYRGWQDDISRGPIPTLKYLKREIRTLSEFKLNAFTLYTEHVFKLDKHPKIAPPDGITAAEVRELVEYGKRHHVEIIGNFQSFGHFAHILRLPEYSHLGERGWVLTPAKEESYEFLKDVYSEIAPAYQSKLFNINCDETQGLGQGASKQMVQDMGLAGVYAYHINRIHTLLQPHGKTVMMWGDIALHHRDIVPQLPKNLIVLSWGYGGARSFDHAIVPFTELGLKFMVCPGVSCWSRIWPDFNTALINISNYVRDGARHGTMGMLNTTWDDDGENFFGYNWYPLVWGAECAWTPAVPAQGQDRDALRNQRISVFDQCFDGLFYGTAGTTITAALRELSGLRRFNSAGQLRDKAFWHDPFARVVAGIAPDKDRDPQSMLGAADTIIETLTSGRRSARHNSDSIEYALFAARRARFMAERKLLRNMLARAISTSDEATLTKQVENVRNRLVNTAQQLRSEYERLWQLENRPWWLDRNLRKYDSLIASFSVKRILSKLRAAQFLRPALVTTNMRSYKSHEPGLAYDGDTEEFFWSSGGGKKGQTLTLILDKPDTFKNVEVLSGHPSHRNDYIHQGVLEVSSDGKTFQRIAEFSKGTAKGSPPKTPIKAVRIRITEDQKYWVIVREIILE